MAPVPESSTISTLLHTILRRLPSPSPSLNTLNSRSEQPPADPGAGVTPFNKVPNKAIFSLFGLLGVFFVVIGIWFFFHAKNGGFYFHENDWEEYKSTVLRRKGPNGTTLSGGTRSTDLGGGSIVHGMSEKGASQSVWGRIKKGRGRKKLKRYQDFDEETAYMGSGNGSDIGSDISALKEKQRAQKAAAVKKEKKSRFRRNKRHDDEETVVTEALSLSHAGVEEDVDPEVRDAVRAYRHEKPARVGGLNKPAEGSNWDGSTEATESDLGLMSHREPTPTSTPTKKLRKERNDNYTGGTGGIRKVVSTSQGNHGNARSSATATESDFWTRTNQDTERERERERIKAEAKKLQEKGRAASQSAHSRSQSHGRRDFSFQHGDDTSTVVSSTLTSTTTTTEDVEREARRAARREERERRRAERERERSGSPKKLSVPGSYYEDSVISGGSEVSGDTGTKSYPCVIPGLSVKKESGAADEYKEERRKRRANGGGGGGGGGGYRRGRRDSLE